MTINISARLDWHDNGWNGCVCRNPKGNTYCNGQFSFPGEMSSERSDLGVETPATSKSLQELSEFLPCVASINAFGPLPIQTQMDPPKWFSDGTNLRTWTMPPSHMKKSIKTRIFASKQKSQNMIRPTSVMRLMNFSLRLNWAPVWYSITPIIVIQSDLF